MATQLFKGMAPHWFPASKVQAMLEQGFTVEPQEPEKVEEKKVAPRKTKKKAAPRKRK